MGVCTCQQLHGPTPGGVTESVQNQARHQPGLSQPSNARLGSFLLTLLNSTRAQIELHPYCTREDVQALCKEHGIVLEAYSPLTKGLKLKEPVLVAIAKEYGVSTAQVRD